MPDQAEVVAGRRGGGRWHRALSIHRSVTERTSARGRRRRRHDQDFAGGEAARASSSVAAGKSRLTAFRGGYEPLGHGARSPPCISPDCGSPTRTCGTHHAVTADALLLEKPLALQSEIVVPRSRIVNGSSGRSTMSAQMPYRASRRAVLRARTAPPRRAGLVRRRCRPEGIRRLDRSRTSSSGETGTGGREPARLDALRRSHRPPCLFDGLSSVEETHCAISGRGPTS